MTAGQCMPQDVKTTAADAPLRSAAAAGAISYATLADAKNVATCTQAPSEPEATPCSTADQTGILDSSSNQEADIDCLEVE